MNPDFVIGTRNPGVIMERYLNDVRDNDRIAYPKSEEETEAAATEAPEPVNMATIEVTPDDADRTVESTPSADETGRRERGRGPEVQGADLTFEDILDIFNPLQHLPIISNIYRAVSGDKITSFAEVAGSAIFGGPLGIISGAINAMFTDETGKPMAETVLASLFGFGDEKHHPEEATLETQLAEAEHNVVTDEDTPGQVQVAADSKIPKTLDAQLAGAMLPPVPPPPTQVAGGKAPFGGVMDMTTIKAAQPPAAVAANEVPRASPLPGSSPPNLAATPHPPVELNGQKFYSLSSVRRRGQGEQASMPTYSGPDVRLKSISRQSASGQITPTQTIAAPKVADPEAAQALGLAVDGSPVAALGLKDTAPLLTPDDADLLPAYGNGSQGVPPALIEDMMKMGLDKYQQGIDSGTLNTRPSVDVRG